MIWCISICQNIAMALSLIRVGQYGTFAAFVADFQLMCTNATVYNPK